MSHRPIRLNSSGAHGERSSRPIVPLELMDTDGTGFLAVLNEQAAVAVLQQLVPEYSGRITANNEPAITPSRIESNRLLSHASDAGRPASRRLNSLTLRVATTDPQWATLLPRVSRGAPAQTVCSSPIHRCQHGTKRLQPHSEQ